MATSFAAKRPVENINQEGFASSMKKNARTLAIACFRKRDLNDSKSITSAGMTLHPRRHFGKGQRKFKRNLSRSVRSQKATRFLREGFDDRFLPWRG